MKRATRLLSAGMALVGVIAIGLAAATPAEAYGFVRFGFGSPVYYAPYYAPPPVYPVYVAPPVVYGYRYRRVYVRHYYRRVVRRHYCGCYCCR